MSRQGTIRRYTLIIEKINRNQFPSFKQIQDYLYEFGFGVSKRTIERDIEAIRNEFAMEISYNRTKEGYFIDLDKSINIETFLRFLEIVNTAELLTESLSESKETLNYISFDKGGGLKGIELLKPLLKAIKENRKISFRHFSFQTEKNRKYSMSPYLLKEYQNRWYIVGFVSGLNQMRTFGIDRIQELVVKEGVFEVDKTLIPLQRFEEAIGVVYADSVIEKVVLSFTPSQGHYIKSLPFHNSQRVLIDDANECRIELNVVVNYELAQLILMHNHEVKVIEPESLVNFIKGTLRSTLDKY